MHTHTLDKWQHSHDFSLIHDQGERKTTQVLVLTTITMVVEIVAGLAFGSMALLADGWHMGTHSAAFGITLFTYRYARIHERDSRFSFGTGKVSILGGFASAIALAVVALVMVLESIQRMIIPHAILFNQAITVAVLGLAVNIISVLLLQGRHHHHDHNLKAAYLHVMADALTSLLAIVALTAGKAFGWVWMDPVMGVVGAAVIMKWSYGLLKETGAILLDGSIDEKTREEIRSAIESDADNRIADLHVWKVGPTHIAAVISLVTDDPKPPGYYKNLLKGMKVLSHVSVEVNPCRDESDRIPDQPVV